MTILEHDNLHDKGAEWLRDNAERYILCAGAPATYAEATTAPAGGKMLADVAVSTGDWTLAAGDTDGRKITLADKTGVAVDAAGNSDHVAVVNDTSSILMLVLPTATTVAVTSGGPTVTLAGFTYTSRKAT